MDALVDELLVQPQESAAAPPGDVIAALVIQRCIAPGSKLYAQRWFPTTALPELLALPPERFNNTRLHRVLDQLHSVTTQLQKRLPALYRQREGASRAFFMDLTDTFFKGAGCEMAERSRTKAGHRNKKAIGIVLLTNELGLPLRWQVVSGKTKDHVAMAEMVESDRRLEWVANTPLICDRAMGRDSSVATLFASGLHLLTAAPFNTIESYTKDLPHQTFSMLTLQGSDDGYKHDVELVAGPARELGMEKVNEHLFVSDLGVVDVTASNPEQESGDGALKKRNRRPGYPITSQLRLAQQLQAKLEAGEYDDLGAMSRALGWRRSQLSRLLDLLRLAPDIQERLLALSMCGSLNLAYAARSKSPMPASEHEHVR